LGQKGAWPTGSSISRTSPAVKQWVAGTAPSSRSEALPLHCPQSLAAGERNAHHDESVPTLHTIHVDGAAAFNLLSISRPCLCKHHADSRLGQPALQWWVSNRSTNFFLALIAIPNPFASPIASDLASSEPPDRDPTGIRAFAGKPPPFFTRELSRTDSVV
jgi:hypothetical protein